MSLKKRINSKIEQILQDPKKWIFLLIVCFATFFRLFLYWKAPYYVNTFAGYDDGLFVQYSQEMLKGDWLGNYNTTTLSKGVSYSLFMVWANKLHVPYSVLLGLFGIAASGLASSAFKPVVKKKGILFFIYLFFLYSPVSLTAEYSTRIYRNSIVVPFVIMIIASVIATYFRKYERSVKLIPWIAVLTFALPFFWYIREDSIWLLPFVVVGLALTVVQMFLGKKIIFSKDYFKNQFKINLRRPEKWTKVVLCCLPFFSLLITHQVIAETNEQHYGIKVVNDRTSGEFGQLMENLIRIDDGKSKKDDDSRIWVSKEALAKAQKVSPTFKKLNKGINWIYHGSSWSQGEDVTGDIIFWALRDAATQSGYYQGNAKSTEKFWHKVNTELERAYQDKRLEKKKEIYLTGSGDGKRVGDFSVVWNFMKTGFSYTASYQDYAQGKELSVGVKTDVLNVENLLHLPLANRWWDINQAQPKIKMAKSAKMANFIISIYQKTAKLSLIIMIMGLFFLITGSVFSSEKVETYRGLLLITTGLIFTYLIFLVGVSWFCSWSPSQKELFMMVYTGAGVIVLQFITVTSIIAISQLSIFGKNLKKQARSS